MSPGSQPALRVLAVMEGLSVTGPAKNLFAFAQQVRSHRTRPVDLSLVTYQRGPDSNAFIEGARNAGIPVDVIREERAFQPSILRELAQVVNLQQPDIVQTHNLKSHFLARVLGIYKERPWIAFHHGYVATDAKVHLYNQLDRWSLRKADRLITVCEPFAEHLRGIGVKADRIQVRHNMIRPFRRPDPADVEQLRTELSIHPDTRVIFCAGRLSKEKGHLDLIEAIGRLSRNPAVGPFRLVIAGIGPEGAAIEQRCRELMIESKVQLVGLQPEIARYYALADLMVLPSHSEGSPNVLLEAMAAGVPTVATAVGGVPEIAEHERSALIVQRGDFRAMADAIARLMLDEPLRGRLAQGGLEVVSRFTPDAYCESVLGIYDRMLHARRS